MTTNNSQPSNSNESGDVKAGRDASNISINGSGNTINVNETGGVQSKSSKKRASRKAQKRKGSNKLNPTIVVALIVLLGTIITAVLSSPLIEKLLFPTPEPSPTPAANVTETPFLPVTNTAVIPSETALPVFTLTLTPDSSATPADTGPVDKMIVALQASATDGKAPLKVNFDARSSYYQFADGTTAFCGDGNLCSFTFAIYLNGHSLIQEDNKSGVFSYTFGGKGEYFVTLYVCRGTTCDDDGVEVNVR